MSVRTFYICYFGVREPLVQTQVLPYLRELIRKDFAMDEALNIAASLLTFEPKGQESDMLEFETIREALADEGIKWDWLPYHKRPSAVATAWDVLRGAIEIRKRIAQTDVLHARSHVPALMAAVARSFSKFKPKLIFDIRGFMPEEYADAGVWNQSGLMFRLAKRVEAWLLKESNGFVVLTQKAKNVLFSSTGESRDEVSARPVEVIPCCVDLKNRFSFDRQELRNEFREKLGIGDRRAIIHVGALGGLYLTDEIVGLLSASRDADERVFAMFLTQSDPVLIEPLLTAHGFGPKDYLVMRVPPREIAGYLCAADVGLSFVRSSYATLSRSPTKIPEYLACGIPVIANAGVGDVDELIIENKVGAIVKAFTSEEYLSAMREISDLGDVSGRCRETGERCFDLEKIGGHRYRQLYQRVLR